MRPRLLPATIAIAGLLFVSKSIGLALPYVPGGWMLQQAVLPSAAAAAEEKHADEEKHAASEKHGQAAPAHGDDAVKGTKAASAEPAKAVAPSAPPPPAISEAELKVLQDLRARREVWDAKDRALAEREDVLKAAQERIVARASELAALQARLEQLEKSRAQREDANWAGLVKLYETMKPRDAAAIFNDMDMPVSLEVVDRMKEAKAAPILAAMLPDRARALTTQLAAKRNRTATLPEQASAPSSGPSHS